MAADVEPESLVLDRARDAADLAVLLEDERDDAPPRQHPRRRKSGGTGADDDGLFTLLVRHARLSRPPIVGIVSQSGFHAGTPPVILDDVRDTR